MSIWSSISETANSIGDSVSDFLSSLSREPTEPQNTVAFTIGMIALGAKMAKADGVVTDAEVNAFKKVFLIAPEDLPAVTRVFNLAKRDVAGYDYYARQVARLLGRRRWLLENILHGLFYIATADGAIHKSELQYLAEVAHIFNFSEQDFERIKYHHVEPEKDDPHVVLGIHPEISDDDLRRRYRRLVRESHPDRHIAAGMPAEIVKLASERMARINAAYAVLERGRGM